MHLLGRATGWPGQAALWRLIDRGDVEIAPLPNALFGRMRSLMDRYHDLPMDLADASLVALAEELATDRIFTLDRDFHVYRLPRHRAFTVIP